MQSASVCTHMHLKVIAVLSRESGNGADRGNATASGSKKVHFISSTMVRGDGKGRARPQWKRLLSEDEGNDMAQNSLGFTF